MSTPRAGGYYVKFVDETGSIVRSTLPMIVERDDEQQLIVRHISDRNFSFIAKPDVPRLFHLYSGRQHLATVTHVCTGPVQRRATFPVDIANTDMFTSGDAEFCQRVIKSCDGRATLVSEGVLTPVAMFVDNIGFTLSKLA